MTNSLPRNLGRRLDLSSMLIFVAVAETGSIGKAAARESIAISAASKRLSDIESAFGAKLMYRSSKGVTLTPAGQNFLRHARIVLRSVDEMEDSLSEYSAGVRGHVRVHATLAAITQFMSAELAAFASTNANIEVDLEERVTAEVIRAVQDGEADIGISTVDEPPPQLECRPYSQDRLVVIVPANHPLAREASTSFEATLEFDHVELHQQSATSTVLHRAAARLNRKLRTRVRVTGPEVMCHMVRVGLGIGILPARVLDLIGPRTELVRVQLAEDWAVRRTELLSRSFSGLPLPARLLIDHLSNSRRPEPG